MIADFVNFVTAAIGFYRAASRLTLRGEVRRGINMIMTNRIGRQFHIHG
jgi:hypothetical protein